MNMQLLAALLIAGQAHALEMVPGAEYSLTGQVSSLRPDRTFVLTSGDDQVLVYARAEQVQALHVGSTVQVRGTVPNDWIKLARLELQAAEVVVRVQ